MKIVSVINWKGGVGKTTITHHLATGLQQLPLPELKTSMNFSDERYPKVLLIDLDPQCNLSISTLGANNFEDLAYKNKQKTVRDLFSCYLEGKIDSENIESYILKKKVRATPRTVFLNVDIIPSHPDLIYTDMDIAAYTKQNHKSNLLYSHLYKFQIIETIIKKIETKYDFVFFDCPPNLNFITQNALYSSDYYLIPTILDKLSSYGILSISNKIDDINKSFLIADKEYNQTNLLGIVANNVREYNGPKQSQYNVLSRLKRLFPGLVFDNYLTNGDGIPKASDQSLPVYALDGKTANATKQSTALRNITREFLKKI